MHARVVTITSQPEKLDEAKRSYQSIEPLWKQQKEFWAPGFGFMTRPGL